MELTGKCALVTGGAGGIGAAIATALVEAGVRVAVADLDLARAEAVAGRLGTGRATAMRLDVTDAASCATARDRLERDIAPCDILVSNAGVSFTGTLDTIDPAAWRWVYDVNVIGSLNMIQAFVPGMKARGTGGHIALTCSITALHPFATQAAYTSSKAALLNIASVLKSELAGTAIGVSAICPGVVATNLRENAIAARPAKLGAAAPPSATLSTVQGMDPARIGPFVVDAIRTDRFFVFTHADYAASVASDRDLMLAAMTRSADPDYREPAAFLAPLPR